MPGNNADCDKRTWMYYKGVKQPKKKKRGEGKSADLSNSGNGVFQTKAQRNCI